MTTNFQVNNSGYASDMDDLFIRKDLFTTGGLWTWGFNAVGQLGDNTITHRSSPIQTVAGGTDWKSMAGGFNHSVAIKTDGTLWTWGNNANGQLGDNTVVIKSSPVQTTSGGTNWKLVACGYYHSSVIKTDGTLWLWGRNTYGQLGTNNTTHRSSPVQTVAGGTNWKSVAAGRMCTLAIKTDGTLWTWGLNAYGQLGDNTVVDKGSPIQTVAGGTNWKQVAGGFSHTAAIKTDGTLWTWGRNENGQLGDTSITHRSSPIQTVSGGTNWRQVSAGAFSSAAIKTDGTLWTWGVNSNGVLGVNDLVHRSSPVQTVAGGTNWKLIASGGYHVGVTKTDGTLWTWGLNANGQLGQSNITHRSSPVQTTSGGTNWKQVACGLYYIITIREDYY